jgi:excisionase family DNA binding protein
MMSTLDINEAAFLSPAQAAVALGVSRETVYRLLRSGALPSVRVGGQLRIPKRTLAQRLAETRGGWPLPERIQL